MDRGVELQGDLAARPVFSVDGEMFTYADVVTAARLHGSWSELHCETRAGLACRERLLAEGGRLDRREVLEASNRFRYERNLLSGEELEEWLDRWDVSIEEWRQSIERALLRERWADELEETATRFPVSADDVAAATWPDAVCTGVLDRAVQRLAADVALAATAGQALGHENDTLAEIRTASEHMRTASVTEAAIVRELAAHSLEWLHVEGESLDLPSEDVAREAVLCIVRDGQTVAEVASAIGVEPRAIRVFMADVEGDLSSALLAASEGELIGPLEQDGIFTLIQVERKAQATASDPDVRERVTRRLVERAVQRAVRDRVEWHEPV